MPDVTWPAKSPTKSQKSGRFRATINPDLNPRRSSRRIPQPELPRHPSPSKAVISTALRRKTEKHDASGFATAVHHDGAPKSSACENGVQRNATKKRKVGAGVDDKKMNAMKSWGTSDVLEQNINQGNGTQGIDFHSYSEPLKTGVAEPHGKKRKKRRSIGQVQRKRPRTQSIKDQLDNGELERSKALTLSAENMVEHSVNAVEGSVQPLGRSAVIKSQSDPRNSVAGGSVKTDLKRVVSDIKAQPKTRKKKRKSIGQIQAPRNKPSIEIKPEEAVQTTVSVGTKSSQSSQNANGQAAVKISRGRGRPKKLAPPVQEETDGDEIIQPKRRIVEGTGTELYESKGQLEKPLPAIGEASQEEIIGTIRQEETKEEAPPRTRKRGRPPKRALSDVTSSTNVKNLRQAQMRKPKASVFTRRTDATMSRKPLKSSALITACRPLSTVALDHDDSELDILAKSPTTSKSYCVNAVDTSEQACHEVDKRNNFLNSEMQEQAGNLENGDIGCTTNIIDRHGEEPANQLFEMVSIPRFRLYKCVVLLTTLFAYVQNGRLNSSATMREAKKEEKVLRAESQNPTQEREVISQHTMGLNESRKRGQVRTEPPFIHDQDHPQN